MLEVVKPAAVDYNRLLQIKACKNGCTTCGHLTRTGGVCQHDLRQSGLSEQWQMLGIVNDSNVA